MTSIEWLIEQCPRIETIASSSVLEQAKLLHKQEIIDAYEKGQKNTAMGFYVKSGESYYNKLKK